MTTVANTSFAAPPGVARVSKSALTVGAVVTVFAMAGMLVDPANLVRSWLVSWLFWFGIAAGSLALLLTQYVITGAWGLLGRRVFVAAAATLPWLLVLFIPVVLKLDLIYLWAVTSVVASDAILQHKAAYLNVPFFILRTAVYFVILWGVFVAIQRATASQPMQPLGAARRTQIVAGFGLVAYALVATFASIDWLMSLDPHWYSSMYGFYFMGGQGLSGFAFLIVVMALLVRAEPLKDVIRRRYFHDWSKLMLAFLMLWGYFSYSQFLIIWSGNLPEEVGWYLVRSHGGWRLLSMALALFHFAVPFALLLSRDITRSPRAAMRVALLILVMRWVDLLWQAKPAFHDGTGLHVFDPLTMVAIGGLWVGLFSRQLARRPLLPTGDPRLQEVLGHA